MNLHTNKSPGTAQFTDIAKIMKIFLFIIETEPNKSMYLESRRALNGMLNKFVVGIE